MLCWNPEPRKEIFRPGGAEKAGDTSEKTQNLSTVHKKIVKSLTILFTIEFANDYNEYGYILWNSVDICKCRPTAQTSAVKMPGSAKGSLRHPGQSALSAQMLYHVE